MLFTISLAALASLAAAGKNSNVCNKFPYNEYVLVSAYPAAQQYCSSFFPVPAVTTTSTTTSTFTSISTVYTATVAYTPPPRNKRTIIDLQARNTQPPQERDLDMAPRATHASALSERGRCAPWDTWCNKWQGIIAQEKQFVKTVCSCLETPVTQTSTVTVPTTTTTTLSTASMCPSATPLFCSGACVANSNQMCGSCSNSCPTGTQCQGGTCVYTGICDGYTGTPAYQLHPNCGNTFMCYCALDTSGSAICYQPTLCFASCNTDADCGTGKSCIVYSETNCANIGGKGTCVDSGTASVCYMSPSRKRSNPLRMVVGSDESKVRGLRERLLEYRDGEKVN